MTEGSKDQNEKNKSNCLCFTVMLGPLTSFGRFLSYSGRSFNITTYIKRYYCYVNFFERFLCLGNFLHFEIRLCDDE